MTTQTCAPIAEGNRVVNGTCFNSDQLYVIAVALNYLNETPPPAADPTPKSDPPTPPGYKAEKYSQINLRPIGQYRANHVLQQQLVAEIKKQMNDCHRCWLGDERLQSLEQNSDFQKRFHGVFSNRFTLDYLRSAYAVEFDSDIVWLSTSNIDDVMRQVEQKYPTFMYLDTVPADVLSFGYYKLTQFLVGLKRNFDFPFGVVSGDQFGAPTNGDQFGAPTNGDQVGAPTNRTPDTKQRPPPVHFGSVINTHRHNQPGEHWIALYMSIDKRPSIYFFDSTGRPPPPLVERIIVRFVRICRNHYAKKNQIPNRGRDLPIETYVDVEFSPVRHQRKNTECGVYSISFLRRKLQRTFNNDQVVGDDSMKECRDVYFNKPLKASPKPKRTLASTGGGNSV